MEDFKLSVSIEPTDKYLKAKTDLIQALQSYGELSPQEQQCLMQEFFGSAQFALAYNMLKQYFK